jgi:drug/metabolite transporter (DMT)-like permease
MPWIEIVLPGSLLLAKFALKLFVDRSATFPDVISALLALPVDIVFLAASLLAGHAIADDDNPKTALGLFVGCIVAAIFIVVFWRRSDDLFSKDKYITTVLFAALNYCISVFLLYVAVNLLEPGGVK